MSSHGWTAPHSHPQWGPTPDGGPQQAPYGWTPPHADSRRPAPPAFAPPVVSPPVVSQPVAAPRGRSAGAVRMGMVGLLAGALIGGGTGAGVALLSDGDAEAGAASEAAGSTVLETAGSATDVAAAAATARPSVVTVYVTGSSAAGSGSGVVLTEDGYVLTNNHVVALDGGGGDVQVRTVDGALYDATVVGTEPSMDLAVLRLENAEGLTPASFADSDQVQVGDLAVAIGAPLGLSDTVTDGIVSATHRSVSAGGSGSEAAVIDALQTDAAINPGNSGGALVNAAGEVIGINTAIATVPAGPGAAGSAGNIGVGFAIPSSTAHRIATEIMADGTASTGLLGVQAQTVSDGQVPTGAGVVEVESGSSADRAGLRSGDVVTAIGDRPIATSTDLTAAVRSSAPGEEVTLTVVRDGRTGEVAVVLGRADV